MKILENRNNNLDILKTICAFLVICIHIPFPGSVGAIITPLARIAVPIFFMITGYFYNRTSKEPFKQIKKVIILITISNLLYFIFDIITNENIMDIFSFKKIVKLIFFNESPFAGHLWYLNALLYVLIIMYIVDKLKVRKFLYYTIPVFLLIDLIFGKYSMLLFGQQIPYILVRNFLFVGLPYFLIGNLIYDNKEKLTTTFTTKKIVFILIFFAITTLVEKYILVTANLNATRDHYISTTFLSIFMLLLFIKIPMVKNNNVLATIGKKYSLHIYIIHLMFVKIYNAYTINVSILNYFIQLIIFIASILVAMLYIKIKNLLLKYKKRDKVL